MSDRLQPPRERRILVVDDNVDAADTVAELLQMMGCEASVAHDGAAAVAAVSSFAPDIVLLDIGLPDMDGYSVARTLRREGFRDTRIIAISGGVPGAPRSDVLAGVREQLRVHNARSVEDGGFHGRVSLRLMDDAGG